MITGKYYFVLGTDACDAYNGQGVEGLLDHFLDVDNEGDVCQFDADTETPIDFANKVIGWHEVVEITETQYKLLVDVFPEIK